MTNNSVLSRAAIATQIGLKPFLVVSSRKPLIDEAMQRFQADALEAFLGAIYLDQGTLCACRCACDTHALAGSQGSMPSPDSSTNVCCPLSGTTARTRTTSTRSAGCRPSVNGNTNVRTLSFVTRLVARC